MTGTQLQQWFPAAVLLRGYLVAFSLVLGAAVGSLAFLMIHHLAGGRWGAVLRRPLEAATRTLPLVLLLFVPLVLNLQWLYPWAVPGWAGEDKVLQEKARLYLNAEFFTARGIGYFVLWIVLAFFLNRWSRWQDRTGDPRAAARMANLSGPGLVFCSLAVTFAAIDWLMSLQPEWFSTIFAVVVGVGQLLTAMALMIIVLLVLARQEPLRSVVSPQVLNDLGNLLLMTVMFWAYVSFSQFLLIWAGNLPEEIAWYVPRYQGGWQWIGIGLLACQFGLPFVVLLWRRTKRSAAALAGVAAFVLVMRVVDVFWQVVPSGLAPASLLAFWPEVVATLVALVLLGSIWLAYFRWQLGRLPLVPVYVPLTEGTHHE